MRFLEKFRLLREFNQLRREARDANPTWDEEECCAYAMDAMKTKYGATPDWPAIIQMILEMIMKLLPFLFLAKDTTAE